MEKIKTHFLFSLSLFFFAVNSDKKTSTLCFQMSHIYRTATHCNAYSQYPVMSRGAQHWLYLTLSCQTTYIYIYIYICRTAPLTSRCCILYIIQQIHVQNILNMLHTLRFFLFKMPFISQCYLFWFLCYSHFIYRCAKIKKKFLRQRRRILKRKKRRVCSMFKIFCTYICWIIYKMQRLEVSGVVRHISMSFGS